MRQRGTVEDEHVVREESKTPTEKKRITKEAEREKRGGEKSTVSPKAGSTLTHVSVFPVCHRPNAVV